MSFRTTYLLFGILGAMVVAFGLALWLAPTAPPDMTWLFPSAHANNANLDVKDIVRVELTRVDDDAHFVFSRPDKDKPFVLESPSGYRINEGAVSQLVSQLLNARPRKGEIRGKLSEFGLEKPLGSAVLTTDKGDKLTVQLGQLRNDQLYVLSSERKKTPLALHKPDVDRLFNTLDQFRSSDLVSWRNDDVTAIKIEQPAKKETVVLEKKDNRWRYVQPAYGAADFEGSTESAAKAPSGVSALLTAFANLKAEGKTDEDKNKKDKKDSKLDLGYVKDNASAEELKKYGVDSPANATMVLELKKNPDDKEGLTILVGKDVEKKDLSYARLESEKHVVTLTKKMLEPFRQLLGNPESLRDRNLVKLGEKPDVVRIKYRDGQTIWLFRSAGGSTPDFHGGFGASADRWQMFRDKEKKGEATDAESVKKMVDLVIAPRSIKDFPANSKDPALGLADPQNLTVSLWSGGIKKEEKKDDKDKDDKEKDDKDKGKKEEKKKEERPELKSDKPDVELVFGQVDSKNLVAVERRTGKDLKQVDVVKVDDALLKSAREDWLVYLDKSVPPLFTKEEDVKKITLDVDGKQTVIERKKPDDAKSEWLFKKPSEWDGRRVDEYLLSNKVFNPLSMLRAKKWEALKPDGEQLGRWGLKAPATKITLDMKVDGKPKEVSLLIGNLTDDKTGYYAKKSDDERVFSIDKTPIDDMKVPLLDMKVFSFAPSSVKTLKLTGWERLGMPATLELEKKGANWEAKGLPAGKKINADKIEDLLHALSELRAKKFLVMKTGPTAAQKTGLDTAKGALAIEITLDDKDKTKLSLTLGADEGSEGFQATSDKLPGDVFVVEKGTKDILKVVKEKLENVVSSS